MANYLLKHGTMTGLKGGVFVPGDVLTKEDLETTGVGVTRALEELRVVEETDRERFVTAEKTPEVAVALASDTPHFIEEDGSEPGVPILPPHKDLGGIKKGEPRKVSRDAE